MFGFIKLVTFVTIFLNILTGIAVACEGCVGGEEAITATNDLTLWISGIIFAVLLGLKAGMGSGLAGLNKRQIIPVIVLYPLLVILVSILFKDEAGFLIIPQLINVFVPFYAVMSLVLIALGVYTVKIWQRGRDISPRSFWALASPCPLLIVALILALMFMPADLSSFRAVLFVALGLVMTIIVGYFAGKLKASPLKLGNLMIAAGLGLMAAALIIPAYLEMDVNIGFSGYLAEASPMMTGGNILLPLVFFSILIILGVIGESIKRGRLGLWKD